MPKRYGKHPTTTKGRLAILTPRDRLELQTFGQVLLDRATMTSAQWALKHDVYLGFAPGEVAAAIALGEACKLAEQQLASESPAAPELVE